MNGRSRTRTSGSWRLSFDSKSTPEVRRRSKNWVGQRVLKLEIRALIRKAGDGLRQSPKGDGVHSRSDMDQPEHSGQLVRELEQEADLRPPAHASHADQAGATTAPCWHHDLRIEDEDRVLPSATPEPYRKLMSPVSKALLLALAIGWIGGLSSYHFIGRSSSFTSEQKRDYLSEASEKKLVHAEISKRVVSAASASNPDKAAGAITGGRQSNSTQSVQQSTPLTNKSTKIAQQNPTPSASSATTSRRTMLAASVSFPETKPITVEGWSVLSIVDGAAVLRGPDGVRKVARGDVVPGLGRVESIVRWGPRWIVATSNGLITTP